LLAYLDRRLPADHPFARLADTLPGRPEQPAPWLLGSSAQSAVWAAELGLPYAFADFINSEGAPIAAAYRERFDRDREDGRRPYTAVAVWVICADTDAAAERIAASGRMAFTMLRRGELIAVPPPEEAERFLAAERAERPAGAVGGGPGAGARRRVVVGDPDAVRTQLLEVVSEYGADEAIAVNVTYAHEDRRRSYELLAEAFALEGAAS
jgi:luciferase family oxidoreductase group 1